MPNKSMTDIGNSEPDDEGYDQLVNAMGPSTPRPTPKPTPHPYGDDTYGTQDTLAQLGAGKSYGSTIRSKYGKTN